MSGFVNFGVRASQKTETRDFNFTGGTLDGATLDRSSTATYLSDSTGFITDAAIDEARWERKSGTLCLMVEPQRTNYSNTSSVISDYSTFTSGSGAISQTLSQTESPDGSNVDYYISVNRSVTTDLAQKFSFYTGPTDLITSVYYKARGVSDEGKIINLSLYDDGSYTPAYNATLTSDWARHSLRITDTGTSTISPTFGYTSGDGALGTGPVDFYAYGTQSEDVSASVNKIASSYIETPGFDPATRAQDQLTVDVPVGETTLQLTFDDDSTQDIDVTADAGATHTIDPDVLNRFHIKYGNFVDPTPLSIPDLALWLDAADTSTITEVAGSVSQWDDKSGNDNHVTQGSASLQPTTGTRTLNGKNVLDFDQDSLQVPAAVRDAVSSSDSTVFCVFRYDVFAQKQVLMTGLTTGSTSYGLIITSANGLAFLHKSAGEPQQVATSVTNDTNYVGVGRNSGIEQFVSASGSAPVTNSNGDLDASLNGNMSIGSYNNTQIDSLDGVIAEIVLYSSAISSSDINRVGSYLSSKWGISWTNI